MMRGTLAQEFSDLRRRPGHLSAYSCSSRPSDASNPSNCPPSIYRCPSEDSLFTLFINRLDFSAKEGLFYLERTSEGKKKNRRAVRG